MSAPNSSARPGLWGAFGFVLLAGVAVAGWTRDAWWPTSVADDHADEHADEHDHAHEEAAASTLAAIELTSQGLKNIGYEPLVIEPTDYQRSLTLPAIVAERPGRSQLHVTAPLTGIVTKIYAATGEAIQPGAALFDLHLTHEELVAAQQEFLETAATLDVVEREIARLEGLGEGVIAGKRILEQRYEQQKLQVKIEAAKQAMLLHGLDDEKINRIRETGELFHHMTIHAPTTDDADDNCTGPHLLTIQQLGVAKGEHVEIGRDLAMLADHCELYIEAQAFEDDAEVIRKASQSQRAVTARFVDGTASGKKLDGLEVLFVAGQIDPQSRAFKIYLRLVNQVALDKETKGGHRFLEWTYKPGQRLELSVPIEVWEHQLVLPATAVVDEGAESYVYRKRLGRFDQLPVHVVHRDQNTVVVANDGAVRPGTTIAGKGAYQVHLALKNSKGGGIDPHAGHNH